MKSNLLKTSFNLFLFVFIACTSFIIFNFSNKISESNNKFVPSDWFYQQRAYPYDKIPIEKYFKAQREKQNLINKNNSIFSESWYPVGPSNIGGRVTALDYDPVNNLKL